MAVERNPVGWFEVPVADMERAVTFYEAVFQCKLDRQDMNGLDMAWFPMTEGDGPGAPGSLVYMPDFYKPTTDGTLVYFTTPSGDLLEDEKRVTEAGGKVEKSKESIGEYGFMSVIHDSEGNRIALHSREG